MHDENYEAVRESTKNLHVAARRLGRAQDELANCQKDFNDARAAYEAAMAKASGQPMAAGEISCTAARSAAT